VSNPLTLPGLDLDARQRKARDLRRQAAPPPKPRRILGVLTDAGHSGFREYQHTHCGTIWELFVSDEEDAREATEYRRPCPVCNPEDVLRAWGQWDELLPTFKRLRDEWCPMTPERFESFSAMGAWDRLPERLT
jgi:hypothetical protein